MISLIIRKPFSSDNLPKTRTNSSALLAPKDQVSRAAKMLAEEYVRLQVPLEIPP
jgi:hypothetical protein